MPTKQGDVDLLKGCHTEICVTLYNEKGLHSG
jgi:hypothetical protein